MNKLNLALNNFGWYAIKPNQTKLLATVHYYKQKWFILKSKVEKTTGKKSVVTITTKVKMPVVIIMSRLKNWFPLDYLS